MVRDCIIDKSLENQMNEVLRMRYADSEKVVELCQDIINQSGEDDMYGKAFGEYYYAEACYRLGRCYEMLNHAIIGLTIQKDYGYNELEIKSYNLLGVYFVMTGDYHTAISYFLVGVELAKKYEKDRMLKTLYNNFGYIFIRIKDYEKAIYFLNLAAPSSDEEITGVQNNTGEQLNTIHYCNLIEAYLGAGKKKQAIELARKMVYTLNDSFLQNNSDVFYSILTRVNYASGKCEQGHSSARMFIRFMKKKESVVELGDIYLSMADFFLEENLYEEAKETLDFLQTVKEQFMDKTLLVQLASLYVKYYRKVKDTEQLFHAYEAYYQANLQLEETIKEERQKNIRINMELLNIQKNQRNMRKINRELVHLSEHDALTGLANRYSINKYCEQMFEEACQNSLKFGVIIVDIDYFKEFNDTYGHVEGDRCICEIAHTIEDCADGLVTARFGGDEFLVMTIGQNDEKLEHTASLIRKNVMELKIMHEGAAHCNIVTVSQGIANMVPEKDATLVDFIRMADSALYKVKKSKRNTFGFYVNE